MSIKKTVWRPVAMISIAMAILVSGNLPPSVVPVNVANAAGPSSSAGDSPTQIGIDELGKFYSDVFAEWTQKGYKPTSGPQIVVPGSAITAQSENKLATVGSYEGKSGVLLWKSERNNWIEYEVDVPQDGLYEMSVSYHPYNDPTESGLSANRHPAILGVQFDGEFLFREARAISLRRKFADQFPIKKAENGDDIRPRPIEIKGWMMEALIDTAGGYSEPFQWYLSKGKHKLRFSGSNPVVIEKLVFQAPTTLPSYEQVASTYKQQLDSMKNVDVLTVQAEQATWKNDVAIQMVTNKDPLMVPNANGYTIFNALGGDRWQSGGQTAAWTIEVSETGLYQFAMRAFQGYSSNKSVFRTIAIDGKVPFKELLTYRFPYSIRWNGTVLGDDDGNPYEFYLEKGTHTLSMTATIGPFQSVVVQGEHVIQTLRKVDEEIRAMNGGLVDKNRTWRVSEDFPELPLLMEEAKVQLQVMADLMLAANMKRDNIVQTIETSIQDIAGYLKYPNEIPYHMDDVSSIIERISGLRDQLVRSPLMLDQLYMTPSENSFPNMEAGLWKRISGSLQNFVHSFIRKEDINEVGENTLNVWVNRGRDYVNLLQEMVNDTFTPQTGIKVKVNLLPNENLLVLANAAGLSPDIALGQPQDKSTDFAMRNALLDLSQFSDFKEVADQFAPGALLPFYYNEGYYALPETQAFRVMFYRKDILSRLGLDIPDTWTDVYDMLPTLQQSGYNFYMPPTDGLPFFYQNGAEFFTKDGMKTEMNTPEAFKSFKQWTDLFNIYDLEKQVPSFFQHFRKGNIPIGVADYNTYIQLTVAAPELTGWWGIAPIPGVKQSDGTVTRWAAGGQSTGFIYKSTKYPEESWTFLKWLLSADTQKRYGSDLESFNGIAFRWNTANIEAFSKLPWPQEDMDVILEQWRWYKEIPNLPGSYFLSRELSNAWNRTVLNGMNYRESLEEAIVNIDREMLRKEQEFGFVSPDGTVLKTLNLPEVKKPWEGVDPYVTK